MPSYEEKLVLLIEEAAEVIKAATKILRFGDETTNLFKPSEERIALCQEIEDFKVIAKTLENEFDDELMRECKWAKKQKLIELGIYTLDEMTKGE